MVQNTSHAVMAQRAEAHDSLDDFPTPPWGTRALCEYVISDFIKPEQTVLEPAANRGFMFWPLTEYFEWTVASDVHDYGIFPTDDFLLLKPYGPTFHWVITNPPFRLAEQFIEKAFEIADFGVAMLVRSQFLESIGRYERLFSRNPPSIIAQFSERLPMVKGRYDPKISTATSYNWLVWIKGGTETKYIWIPPCRKRLEKPEDIEVRQPWTTNASGP